MVVLGMLFSTVAVVPAVTKELNAMLQVSKMQEDPISCSEQIRTLYHKLLCRDPEVSEFGPKLERCEMGTNMLELEEAFLSSPEYASCAKCKNSCLEPPDSCIQGKDCMLQEVAAELWELPSKFDSIMKESTAVPMSIAGKKMEILVNAKDYAGGEDKVKGEIENDVYGLSVLKALSGSDCGVVIDIGCNIGMFSLAAFAQNPNLKILCVEPMPHTYMQLRMNLKNNKVPILDPSALHDTSCSSPGGVLPINAAVNSDGASVKVFYDPEHTKNGATSKVAEKNSNRPYEYDSPGLDLRTMLWETDHISFFKMDCEGCEHDVAAILEPVIERARWVAAEIHPIAHFPPAMISDTRQIMCNAGGCCTQDDVAGPQMCHS